MPDENATYAVSVYGVVIKDNKSEEDKPSEPSVLVTVLNDQAREKQAAGLAATSSAQMVALLGGRIRKSDPYLGEGLSRRVKEQTRCDAKMISNPVGPCENSSELGRSLAFGCRIELNGKPQTTDQVLSFRWVSLADLTSKTKVCFSASNGHQSSMLKIVKACLKQVAARKPAHDTDELILR